MRLALALGAAAAGLVVAADALADRAHVIVRHASDTEIDADGDSWITRAEAAAAADRMFERMDRNDDGRLTTDDHPPMADFDIRVEVPEVEVLEGEDGDRRIRIIRRGADGERVEREIELAEQAIERAEREAERAARHAERAAEQAERRAHEVERRVFVMRSGDGASDVHVIPPVAPIPPHRPLFMMLFASSEEADTNGDGALSRDEFRAQQMRFFDASDANGDGRIRRERPPTPPAAPEPPRPPRPPR
jgi:hypothetical protein